MIDVFDILAIENEVAGFQEPCVGDVIPGRGPVEIPTTRQSITTTSSPDLIVGPGESVTLTNDRVWQLEGILDVQNGGTLTIQAGTRIEGVGIVRCPPVAQIAVAVELPARTYSRKLATLFGALAASSSITISLSVTLAPSP
ncbi:MAG: hypothetical protein HC937_03710 [Aquincola sp.]|nr:hypothetical protein [Aquincola sp.]